MDSRDLASVLEREREKIRAQDPDSPRVKPTLPPVGQKKAEE